MLRLDVLSGVLSYIIHYHVKFSFLRNKTPNLPHLALKYALFHVSAPWPYLISINIVHKALILLAIFPSMLHKEPVIFHNRGPVLLKALNLCNQIHINMCGKLDR